MYWAVAIFVRKGALLALLQPRLLGFTLFRRPCLVSSSILINMSSDGLFDDAEMVQDVEIPAAARSRLKAHTSFTADSPYYTSFCEQEMRQVTILSETLKDISSRAKTFGKCGAIMAESTRRLSSACRLEKQTLASNSDDEGDSEGKSERDLRDLQERKQAIGQDMSNVLQLLAEVLDEIARAQVQMCEALQESLVASLESFADLEMKQVSSLKSEAEQITADAEASFAKYLNGRHAQGLGQGMDAWNKVSESVTSQILPTIQQWKHGTLLVSPPLTPKGGSFKTPPSSKSRRQNDKHADPNQVQAATAANLQLTLEQIRLAQASAELKRFQLLKKLVSIKKRRNFELGENALASLHGIRAYFNNCSDLVQGLAPRLKRIQNNQSASREKHNSQQAPWEAREDGLVLGLEAVGEAVDKAFANADEIAQGNQDAIAAQPILLEEIEEQTEIWNLPYMLAECSRYQRDPSPGVLVEGWLYKKSSSRMSLQQWSRRWFMMDKDGIYYFHSTAEIKKANGGNGYLHTLERVKICDTVLCMVRELKNDGLRFRFEIVTPNQKPLQLQACGPVEYKMWVDGIRLGAENQLVHGDVSADALMQGLGKKKKKKGESSSTGKTLGSMVEPDRSMSGRSASNGSNDSETGEVIPTPEFRECDREDDSDEAAAEPQASAKGPRNPLVQKILDANPVCADCGRAAPDWACINLGLLVCIECSGVHRGLGVHLSKVRSLRMDALTDSEARLLLCLGNDKVNPIWEAGLENQRGWKKPSGDDSRKTKEDWIKSKYQWKGFLEVDSSDDRDHDERLQQINHDLYQAASKADLLGVTEALAHGADVEWKNHQDGGKTALHACAVSKPASDEDEETWFGIECAELLLQNGAKMKTLDDNHQGTLDCAVIGGAERKMIEFLSARSQ